MRANHYLLLIAVMVTLLVTISCAGNTQGTGTPISPGPLAATQTPPSPIADEAGHYLWGWYQIYVDPANNKIEVMPARLATGHWNILKFLEQGPCTTCFKITGMSPGPDGTHNINIMIKHPFPLQNFTGFDVRGIAIFDGSHPFPVSGLTVSDRALGDGELVNADGYTALYNTGTMGSGPGGFEGYFKGKKATVKTPNSILNGFKRFVTNNPANTRNAFYAADQITVTFQVDFPDGAFVFGYAVDASWAPPITKPVVDPMTNFGPEANCPEAWKIDVSEAPVGDGLTDCGGSTVLTLNVYDSQGKDDAHPIVLECPGLFDGSIEATWKADATGYTSYEATVSNAKNVWAGKYKCLIGKESSENNPGKPWLNLTAYQVREMEVIAHPDNAPTASAQAGQTQVMQGQAVDFDATASKDNDCGDQAIVKYEWDWNGDGSFVEGPALNSHTWDTIGDYGVQLRVTDDEGTTATLDTPLAISVSEFSNVAPVITAVTHSRTTSQRNSNTEKVTLGVEFTDPDPGDSWTYLWTCPDGAFDDSAGATPSWTAPLTVGKYDITVRVTDYAGMYDEGTCKQWVTKWPTLKNTQAPGNLIISQSLATVDNGNVDPAGYKWPDTLPDGSVIYCNFFATWCGPCMAEMPELNAMYQLYKSNPEYVHLLFDLQESLQTVQNFIDANDYECTHWMMDSTGSYYNKSIGWTTNPGYIPTHLIFDRDGHCRGQYVGSIPSMTTLTQYIDELL